MGLYQIITGDQSGVEQGAYEAAYALGFHYTELTPEEEERISSFVEVEEPWKDCDTQSEQNVLKSDATLFLAVSRELEGETLQTKELCDKHEKPYFVLNLRDAGLTDISRQKDVLDWLAETFSFESVKLNVTGPTESECAGIQELAKEFVSKLLNMLPVMQLRKVLARTVKPEELEEAVEWATQSGEDEEMVQPFIDWALQYGPTTAHEVAQMSFHLVKPSGWRKPTRL